MESKMLALTQDDDNVHIFNPERRVYLDPVVLASPSFGTHTAKFNEQMPKFQLAAADGIPPRLVVDFERFLLKQDILIHTHCSKKSFGVQVPQFASVHSLIS